MHKVNFNSQCTVGNLLYELNCMLIHRSPTPQWLQRKIDFDPLLQKCARRTQEPVIYVAGSLFVLVCLLAIALDK